MASTQFNSLITDLTGQIAGRPLDGALQDWLNQTHGSDTPWYRAMRESCTTGVAEGWLCNREADGIRYGRVIKPSPESQAFSVDVVDMHDCAGPHHVHPTGEIDLVLPLTPDATFDGTAAGWKVYGPGSAHSPTVRHGRALVLYLLPEGRIEFTRG
ncbi:DUF4863 family protein [Verticiella sediminum]|uniref:DUF4863 family protein n=1 Tax=Verticiella sediminum TaxID=1247510 RepID=A0A556ANP3_9BURK|nr:DUF4863 family protein [Verticiella sediminum]TSH94506.1 DUF4863 family protein [Verticiella sediminum]